MQALRFDAIAHKPTLILDMTSLTVDEFGLLVPAMERAFEEHMRDWRLDGKPRTARKYTTYTNCPLPTPEDRLLFILSYLKTNPLQVAHGLLFGLPQGKTNQWIHLLLPVLRRALQHLGDAPSRSLPALAQRLAVLEADTADMHQEEPDNALPVPLFVTMAPNDASHAPKILLNRKAAIAARKNVIR